MKEERDYVRDIAEIRSMMERSSKFLSLSGWAGIMAGIYALSAAYIAYTIFHFNPDEIIYIPVRPGSSASSLPEVITLAVIVLIIAIATAVFLSHKKAHKTNGKLWNATTRKLLINMAVPLVSGGILILILIDMGLIGLIAPLTLLFYGLALYNASLFTFPELRVMGLIEIGFGLISCYFVEYGLLFWALGFGVVHIIYGIYMHYKYEQ